MANITIKFYDVEDGMSIEPFINKSGQLSLVVLDKEGSFDSIVCLDLDTAMYFAERINELVKFEKA